MPPLIATMFINVGSFIFAWKCCVFPAWKESSTIKICIYLMGDPQPDIGSKKKSYLLYDAVQWPAMLICQHVMTVIDSWFFPGFFKLFKAKYNISSCLTFKFVALHWPEP